jgi:hypothetical protein
MPGPPKPKDEPPDLAEVDRAVSVLKGRHPEHERARREDEQAVAQRRAEIDASARVARREAWRKRAIIAAITLAVLAVGGLGGSILRSEFARRGRVEQITDPFRAMGFTVVETSGRGAPSSLAATAPEGCLVAVGTSSAPLTVSLPSRVVEGPGPVLFCLCEAAPVTVAGEVGEGGGLALLRADAELLGGSRAFPFAPLQAGTTAATDEACAQRSLDAWVGAGRGPKAGGDSQWLEAEPKRAALSAVGFAVVGGVAEGAPFGVVEIPPSSCAVLSSSRAEDAIHVRLRGGGTVASVEGGPVARCASDGGTFILEREGEGEVTVISAPATRVGGMLGLREVAEEAGVELAMTVLPPADHGWSAKQTLLASAVPEALIGVANAPEIARDDEARLVALSFATPNALTSESPDDVFSYCDPPVGAGTREAVCVFSGPQTWRIGSKDAVGGLARAKLPFWLFGLKEVSDPVAQQAETQLVSLARRLKRGGFEPTTIDAMTETATGVEVMGRTGEDAVVAVGLAPSAPWIFPYTDGPSWTVTGEPRVVAAPPREKVSLVSTVRNLPPKASRRTVVFRRQAR